MDEDGFVNLTSVGNVAHEGRITLEEAEEAIKILEDPDPNSADQDHEGRRIEKVPGGWMVLNAAKYRDIVTREIAREQVRKRVARHRAKLKGNADVTGCNGSVTPSEAEVLSEADTKKKKSTPTLKEVVDFLGSETIGTEFFDYYESNGWRVGRNPMKDWKAAARRWKRTNYGSNQRRSTESGRGLGTANEGKSAQYAGVGKIRPVSNPE